MFDTNKPEQVGRLASLMTSLALALVLSVAFAGLIVAPAPTHAASPPPFALSTVTDSTATAAPETRRFSFTRTALADDGLNDASAPASAPADNFLAPRTALADPDPAAPPRTSQPSIPKPANLPGPDTTDNPVNYFKSFMGALTRGIIGILGFLAVFFLVYGGFIYVTSGGDPERAKKGKSIFVYAVVGLLLAAFSYAIVSTLVSAPGKIAEQLESRPAAPTDPIAPAGTGGTK